MTAGGCFLSILPESFDIFNFVSARGITNASLVAPMKNAFCLLNREGDPRLGRGEFTRRAAASCEIFIVANGREEGFQSRWLSFCATLVYLVLSRDLP